MLPPEKARQITTQYAMPYLCKFSEEQFAYNYDESQHRNVPFRLVLPQIERPDDFDPGKHVFHATIDPADYLGLAEFVTVIENTLETSKVRSPEYIIEDCLQKLGQDEQFHCISQLKSLRDSLSYWEDAFLMIRNIHLHGCMDGTEVPASVTQFLNSPTDMLGYLMNQYIFSHSTWALPELAGELINMLKFPPNPASYDHDSSLKYVLAWQTGIIDNITTVFRYVTQPEIIPPRCYLYTALWAALMHGRPYTSDWEHKSIQELALQYLSASIQRFQAVQDFFVYAKYKVAGLCQFPSSFSGGTFEPPAPFWIPKFILASARYTYNGAATSIYSPIVVATCLAHKLDLLCLPRKDTSNDQPKYLCRFADLRDDPQLSLAFASTRIRTYTKPAGLAKQLPYRIIAMEVNWDARALVPFFLVRVNDVIDAMAIPASQKAWDLLGRVYSLPARNHLVPLQRNEETCLNPDLADYPELFQNHSGLPVTYLGLVPLGTFIEQAQDFEITQQTSADLDNMVHVFAFQRKDAS